MRRWAAFALLGALAAPVSAAAPIRVDDLVGAYRQTGKVQMGMSGPIETVEDILELVKIDSAHAYFRTRLIFHSAHICAAWGVADFKNGALTYRETKYPRQPNEKPCTLRIQKEDSRLVLHDQGSCSDNCGAFSSFEGASFPASSRRDIGYLAQLKSSREYAEALSERRNTR